MNLLLNWTIMALSIKYLPSFFLDIIRLMVLLPAVHQSRKCLGVENATSC